MMVLGARNNGLDAGINGKPQRRRVEVVLVRVDIRGSPDESLLIYPPRWTRRQYQTR